MSVPGNSTVDPAEYKKYMKSNAWRKTRKRFFASKLDKSCYICGDENSPKDLHHRTYKNLGNERLMDLVPTCRPCHQAVHDLQKELNLDIWSATAKLRKIYRKTGCLRPRSGWGTPREVRVSPKQKKIDDAAELQGYIDEFYKDRAAGKHRSNF